MTIRLGILGATRGLNFAFVVEKYGLDAQVAAICDSFKPLLDRVCEQMPTQYGINAEYYANYAEMLANQNIDAVIVANNATEHQPAAICALNAGKHVLSECLAVQTPAQAAALADAVEQSGKRYNYAENYCYFPANFEAALRFQRGDIGELVEAEGDFINDCTNRWHILTRGLRNHWRNYVPATFYCSHSIGPMLFAVRSRPVRVTGFEIRPQEYMTKHGARSGAAAEEMIQLENGAYIKSLHGNLKRSWVTRMRLYGTKGSLETDNANTLTFYRDTGAEYGYEVIPVKEWTKVPGIPENIRNDSDAMELWCFLGSIQRDETALKYSIDVYSALEMTMPGIFAYRSILNGGVPVTIPNVKLQKDRDVCRSDRKCTDPSSLPEDILPSSSYGCMEQPDSVYEKEQKLLKESMEKRFRLGMN